MTDHEAVREYLRSWGDGSWSKPDNDAYVDRVVSFMEALREDYPDGDFPAWIHGPDETGACEECDALKVLDRLDNESEGQ